MLRNNNLFVDNFVTPVAIISTENAVWVSVKETTYSHV